MSTPTQRQSARRQLDTLVARDAVKLRPLTPARRPLEIAEVFRTADAYHIQAQRALAEGFLPAAACNTARAVRHSATYERVDQVEARDAEELLLITERLLAVVERELVDGLPVTLDRLRYEEPPS